MVSLYFGSLLYRRFWFLFESKTIIVKIAKLTNNMKIAGSKFSGYFHSQDNRILMIGTWNEKNRARFSSISFTIMTLLALILNLELGVSLGSLVRLITTMLPYGKIHPRKRVVLKEQKRHHPSFASNKPIIYTLGVGCTKSLSSHN